MKRKSLVLSLLTVVCCLSLLVGATLALFASKQEVDISVTSGNVEVKATISDYSTYSKGVEMTKGTFENGGTAKVEGNSVVLDRISPMDKIVLEIAVSNKSNIAYQYRMKLGTETENTLYDLLLVGLSEDGTEYTYYSSYVTAWQKGTEQTETTLYLSVELPEYVKSAWQGQECAFALTFEAVQGNATVTDEAEASLVYIVETQDKLDEAIAKMKDYDTVVLGGGEWAAATISFDDERTINVRGYKIGTITVHAPNGTVNLYNDADLLICEAIAENSLHVYGEIGSALIKEGRAVLEAGAAIASMSVEPGNTQEAKIEIKSESNVQRIQTNPADDGKAIIIVDADATVPALNVSGTGETALDNNGTIEDTQVDDSATLTEGAVTLESFLTKLAAGGEISVASDITLTERANILSGSDVSVNLEGNTITSLGTAFYVEDGARFSLVNGTVNSGSYTIYATGSSVIEELNIVMNANNWGVWLRDQSVLKNVTGGIYRANVSNQASFPIYISSDATVEEISAGDFQGSKAAIANYGTIKKISGGTFHGTYYDGVNTTAWDPDYSVMYNGNIECITGGTFFKGKTNIAQNMSRFNAALKKGGCVLQETEESATIVYNKSNPKTYTGYYYNVVAE